MLNTAASSIDLSRRSTPHLPHDAQKAAIGKQWGEVLGAPIGATAAAVAADAVSLNPFVGLAVATAAGVAGQKAGGAAGEGLGGLGAFGSVQAPSEDLKKVIDVMQAGHDLGSVSKWLVPILKKAAQSPKEALRSLASPTVRL